MNRLKVISGLAVVLGLAVGADAATKKGGSKTLTGCLQKGTEAGTYMLTNVSGGPAADNKEWRLMDAPAALKLDDHVGHKVAVTGSVMGVGVATKVEHKATTTAGSPADAADVKVETKTTMKEHADRHLMVKSMKHIAGTCP